MIPSVDAHIILLADSKLDILAKWEEEGEGEVARYGSKGVSSKNEWMIWKFTSDVSVITYINLQ